MCRVIRQHMLWLLEGADHSFSQQAHADQMIRKVHKLMCINALPWCMERKAVMLPSRIWIVITMVWMYRHMLEWQYRDFPIVLQCAENQCELKRPYTHTQYTHRWRSTSASSSKNSQQIMNESCKRSLVKVRKRKEFVDARISRICVVPIPF